MCVFDSSSVFICLESQFLCTHAKAPIRLETSPTGTNTNLYFFYNDFFFMFLYMFAHKSYFAISQASSALCFKAFFSIIVYQFEVLKPLEPRQTLQSFAFSTDNNC